MTYSTKNNDWKITGKDVTYYLALMEDWTISYWVSNESLTPNYLMIIAWDKASPGSIHKLIKLLFDVDEVTSND